ncbi:MAG: hypothetical protein WCA96_00865 [Methylocella sp.]
MPLCIQTRSRYRPQQLGGSLSVHLFDGDVVAEASRGINSPFYETEPALA